MILNNIPTFEIHNYTKNYKDSDLLFDLLEKQRKEKIKNSYKNAHNKRKNK